LAEPGGDPAGGRSRGTRRRVLIGCGAVALASLIPVVPRVSAQGPVVRRAREPAAPRDIKVTTSRLTSFSRLLGADRRGRLQWLGGLTISSDEPRFGGLSGLITGDRGRSLLAVGDNAHWLAARVVTADDGTPLGLDGARMARLLDANGRTMSLKDSDSESLTLRDGPAGPEVLVGFERNPRVLAYSAKDFPDGVMTERGRVVPTPPDIRKLPINEGLEAIAAAPKGGPLGDAVVLIGEGSPDGGDSTPGWIVGGPRAGAFRFAVSDNFAPTDATFLPGGDLMILERRFSFLSGFAMRLTIVPVANLGPGSLVVGTRVLEADVTDEIDNMEGLAVDQAPDGGTILTLVSDDNHRSLQRTVLLRFRLDPAVL
jgi:hypothetical protein